MKIQAQTAAVTSGQQDRSMSRKVEHSFERRFLIGAEPQPGGGTHFRVWAPESARVVVEFGKENPERNAQQAELDREDDGYHSGYVIGAEPGMLYRFKLGNGAFPDPASRFQPQGPHGPSEIVDAMSFSWHDQAWPGTNPQAQVLYEMHIGTFTQAGTWAAAEKELPELSRLGITTLEVMPVAEFPGRFGWGYDGVDLFAPTRLYGRPDDFRKFVDRAHALGLAVILDVVYNHFGPDGNYLKQFSANYFTDRYQNEWGEAINFDGEQCQPVREFISTNAAYWVQEFHLDGLRLDATQQIFDSSQENIQTLLARRVRQAANGRTTFLVAENEPQDVTLARSPEQGGYGLDALWNDDWHHAAMVALTGHADAYYSDFTGSPQEFISAAKRGFLYQGQFSRWQKNPRGSRTLGLAPHQFVNFLQNHDQVANSLHGLRAHQLTSPGRLRALTTLLLLGPATPMLFQGQEFGASAPFLYFADHRTDLAQLVAEGRRNFLSQFSTLNNKESRVELASPHSLETFTRCQLDWSERSANTSLYELHRDLLRLRREDPVFSKPRADGIDGAVLGPECFVLRFFGEDLDDRLVFINLGRDLLLQPTSEPLLGNNQRERWKLLWSSESPHYAGSGTPPSQGETGWFLPGHSAVVFAAGSPSVAAAAKPKS